MKRRHTAVVLAGLLSACGQSPSNPPGAQTETPSAKDLPRIALGQAGQASNLELTVKSVKLADQVGYEGIGPKSGEGETFVVVRYSVRNLGKEPVSSVDLPSVELMDDTGQSYAEDREASVLEAALDNDIDGSSDINPKVSARLVTVWKVETASFDKATWTLKASFDAGLSAMIDKAAKWPFNDKAQPPLIFELK